MENKETDTTGFLMREIKTRRKFDNTTEMKIVQDDEKEKCVNTNAEKWALQTKKVLIEEVDSLNDLAIEDCEEEID